VLSICSHLIGRQDTDSGGKASMCVRWCRNSFVCIDCVYVVGYGTFVVGLGPESVF